MKLLRRHFDRHDLLLAALTALAMATPIAHAQASAAGSIVVNGKKTELTHAYAFTRPAGVKDMVKTTLILADKPLPDAAVTDTFERLAAQRRDGIKMMVVRFNDEKDIVGFSTEVDALTGDRISSAHKVAFDTFSDQTIKGRLFTTGEQQNRMAPGTYGFDVQFNVAMTAPPVPHATGKKAWDTPQGKTLAEYLRAARAGDKAAIKRVVIAEVRAELDGAKGASTMKFLQADSADPKTADFDSLTINGNVAKAKITVRRKSLTETTGYELRKVGDVWLVAP
jgi:hypothetical protein